MMRFPVRLAADLALARFAPKLQAARGAGPIQFVDAAEILHHGSSRPVSHERIREINRSQCPVVWIGGREPLGHPGISHLVRAITQTGHFVFLETGGALLRRRIHEFQPVPRLFLTVRLDPSAQSGTPSVNRPGARELAAEGMRAARLSGFLMCVHARVHAATELGEVAELVRYAHAHDVDGIVITTADSESSSSNPDAPALQQKTAAARRLIGSKWWESFSQLAEPALSSQRGAEKSGACFEQESHADEEGVRIV